MNNNTSLLRESRGLRRIIFGGIMAAVVATSTIAFAGEASARKPRGSSQDQGCVQPLRDYRENNRLKNQYWDAWQATGSQTQYDLFIIASNHAQRIYSQNERCFS